MNQIARAIKIGKNKETAGDLIDQGRCPVCSEPILPSQVAAMDELSRREFIISGLCQKCQDITFSPPPKSRQEVLDEAGS